tara:strand:- start:780 stop:992 length:213 start_codon:yes stop_codon:yes gene_type:complete
VITRERGRFAEADLKPKKISNGVDRCFTCSLFGGEPEINCEKCGIKLKCEHCGMADVKIHSCTQGPEEAQ